MNFVRRNDLELQPFLILIICETEIIVEKPMKHCGMVGWQENILLGKMALGRRAAFNRDIRVGIDVLLRKYVWHGNHVQTQNVQTQVVRVCLEFNCNIQTN